MHVFFWWGSLQRIQVGHDHPELALGPRQFLGWPLRGFRKGNGRSPEDASFKGRSGGISGYIGLLGTVDSSGLLESKPCQSDLRSTCCMVTLSEKLQFGIT